MKIIIIILICLFFSLTITPVNEYITNPPIPQTSTTGFPPAQQQSQPLSDSGLQTQVNMLSTQITSTNAIALEAKKKSDDIASQINELKESLKKAPDI